ncbi:MAG: methyl-accepting chemotaxis protein [Spirochaetales bacterium]|nr:methyl-accepting chemotaxis protein [Spirochaetales bacterium]
MKIRVKLLLLLTVLLLSFAVAFGSYLMLQIRVGRITAEQNVLEFLHESLVLQGAALEKMILYPLDDQLKELKTANFRTEEAFARLDELYLLPEMNGMVRESLTRIGNLYSIISSGMEELFALSAQLTGKMEKVYMSREGIAVIRFYQDGFQHRVDSMEISFVLKNFLYSLDLIQTSLSGSIAILEKQKALIAGELDKTRAAGVFRTVLVISTVVLIGIVFSLVLGGSMAGTISKIQKSISAFSMGNISDRIYVGDSGELGVLSSDLNAFAENLGSIIGAHRNAE